MREETLTLLNLMENAGIPSHIFEDPFGEPEGFDGGLRSLVIYPGNEPYGVVISRVKRLKENRLYHLEDTFGLNYAVMKLPEKEMWLSVGPMIIRRPDENELLAVMDRLGISHSMYVSLRNYFDGLPEMKSRELLYTIAFSAADTVFSGRERYTVEEILDLSERNALQHMISAKEHSAEESLEGIFENIQKRYDLENSFIKAVASGNTKEALSAYYAFVRFVKELIRVPDRLRDNKDLGITLNTLLRKAAEQAGVHPFHIDAFSNSNISRLEQCSNQIEVSNLYQELITGYAELIRKYALDQYSQPVREAIFLIKANLSSELTLAEIADKLRITRSYLSAVFSKETGKKLSDYVMEQRIQMAQHLLSTTPLPIQDIAAETGIPDPNYFSRVFKKYTGYTPREYRRNVKL